MAVAKMFKKAYVTILASLITALFVLNAHFSMYGMEATKEKIDIQAYIAYKQNELASIERKKGALVQQKSEYEKNDTGDSLCDVPVSILMSRATEEELVTLELFYSSIALDIKVAEFLLSRTDRKNKDLIDSEMLLLKKSDEFLTISRELEGERRLVQSKQQEAESFQKQLQESKKKYLIESEKKSMLITELKEENKSLFDVALKEHQARESLKSEKSVVEEKYAGIEKKFGDLQKASEQSNTHRDVCTEGIRYLLGLDGRTYFIKTVSLFNKVIKAGYSSLLLKLLNDLKINLDMRDSLENSLLHYAIKDGAKELVVFLLANGANVEAKNSSGETPLFVCAQKGTALAFDQLQLLMQHGANTNYTDFSDRTLLHYACEGGSLPIVTWLIKTQKASQYLHALNNFNQTPFHFACSHKGSKELIQYLLSIGANKDTKNKEGKSPFHCICFRGDLALVQYFVDELGCKKEINIPDKTGKAALHFACLSSAKEKMEVVKLLIDRGANVRAKTKNEDTVLHCAAESCDVELMKYLVETYRLKEKINDKNRAGETPLYRAISAGNVKSGVLHYLVAIGADIDEPNALGQTPLFRACTVGSEGLKEIVQFLRANGAESGPDFRESVVKAREGKVNHEIMRLLGTVNVEVQQPPISF